MILIAVKDKSGPRLPGARVGVPSSFVIDKYYLAGTRFGSSVIRLPIERYGLGKACLYAVPVEECPVIGRYLAVGVQVGFSYISCVFYGYPGDLHVQRFLGIHPSQLDRMRPILQVQVDTAVTVRIP